MKTKLLSLFVLSLLTLSGFSQKVNIEDAQRVAINFYYERANQHELIKYENINVSESYLIKSGENTIYYVFNIFPSGYVFVSGTKSSIPVPAYSLKSTYSDVNQPPQFKAWVKQYFDQINHAIENQIIPPPETVLEWNRLLKSNPGELNVLKDEKAVSPMLLSTWNQGNFYNQMCPADPGGPSGHCYTGCVATAMGQLCDYFRWPDTGVGSYTYEHATYGTISANFEETQYLWNEMVNSVNSPNPAVAEILFHLGVSVDMVYGPDGSGMYNHKAAYSLRTYFKYAPEAEYLYRDSTNLTWDSVVVSHLDQGIPMYYAGWSVPNLYGHAFIVDGYQDGGFFHFNWGWGGSSDGYFYLDELNPGGSNFNLAQELVINCYPDTLSYTYPNYCTGIDTLKMLRGTIDDGSCPRNNYQDNSSCSWLIDPQLIEDSVSNIVIEFDRFETESGNDIVTIYDGGTTNSPILGQFSGNSLPDDLISSGNKVLITFSSNESITAPGWFISYKSIIPVWCSGLETLTDAAATFGDGSGSFYYQNGSACMWKIQPPGASQITLSFLDFDTELDEDEVKIYDAVSSQLLEIYSGTYEPGNLPGPVTSPSGEMMVIFSSNSTITKQGWTASYSIEVGVDDSFGLTDNIQIFPNPVKDFVTIDFNLIEAQSFEIFISDLKGQVFYTEKIENQTGSQTRKIDLSGFGQGVYFIRIIGVRNSYVQKIIMIE